MPIYIFHTPRGHNEFNFPDDDYALKMPRPIDLTKIEFAPTGRIVWEKPAEIPQYPKAGYYGEPLFKYLVGQPVFKPNGYSFEGDVRAAFTTKKGEIRYVVELTGGGNGNGMLHIFAEGQLEPAS